jgi:pepsin A
VTIPLAGCPSTGYTAPFTIAGETFQMIVDTGSTDTAVSLSTCQNCDVTTSYTDPTDACTSTQESSQYGDGSGWNGVLCSASAAVGTEMPAVTFEFAGITDQMEFLPTTDCAGNDLSRSTVEGILGLGPLDIDTLGQSADDAYFNELVRNGVTDTLAVLLCSSGGSLWFGGYDASFASGSPQWTPMTMSDFWAVNLASIGLGSTNLGGADAQAIVDTGTELFIMAPEAYNSLVHDIQTNAGATEIFGPNVLTASFFDNVSCATPSGGETRAQVDAALPPLTLTFPDGAGGSFTLSLPATESYLAATQDGEYCGGVYNSGSAEAGNTIIGDAVLHANITVFDEGNSRVGFVPQASCE